MRRLVAILDQILLALDVSLISTDSRPEFDISGVGGHLRTFCFFTSHEPGSFLSNLGIDCFPRGM